MLRALTTSPSLFAGGVSYCGVADTKALEAGTHKLESQYLEHLLFRPGLSSAEREKLHHERSPVFHAAAITAPLLLVHGDKDVVVPIQQSTSIRERIEERGGDVRLVVLKDEGHSLARPESWLTALGEVGTWWAKTLLKGVD